MSVIVRSIAAAALILSGGCVALASEEEAVAADLAVTNLATQALQRGELLTDEVTVANNGPSDAGGVRLFVWIDGRYTLGSVHPSQGSCTSDGSRLTCDLGVLPRGDVAAVTILLTPTAAGPITSTARVISNELDPDPSNNMATEGTIVRALPTRPGSVPGPRRTPV
ncbi:MAG TPA: DUF11 domain-containing protein [Chloroflexota bacterium]|nr:DUF11 domain-containing protein [Chloroflexota bacterium]